VGNLTQLTNARNHSTAFTYDPAGRLTQVRDSLNQVTTYQYDAAGNRTRMTDRKAQVHQYAYDQANRLTSVIAGGQTISYTYDANGNRLAMVDPTGTTTFQYDSLDRQTRATYPDGRAVQATYDRAGNRTSLTNPGGITTTYAYDAANRLSQMAQGTLTWTFAYDAAGNRTRLTHPNGTSTDYAYLNNHWLHAITDKAPGGATFQSTSYTHDPNGNRLTQADSSGTTTFAYDALNRLIQAAHPGGYGTWAWTYDAVGNRTQQTGPGGTTNYAYDHNSRLTQAGSTTYSYDQNGNLTATSTGQTFSWDVFNRLTQATGSGGTVTHTYNGDGLKTRRVGPDGTRNYYYDGIKPIWETDAAGTMTAQYDRDIFGNLLSRREASGARRYYHFDGLGSTTALTNESGAATPTLLYDAWGNQRAATGSDQGRYRFTGAELDTATGLYHMGARFYDPTIGRWLSEDPVQDKHFEPGTLNFYAYVHGNPLLYVDPDGKAAIVPAIFAGLAALAVRLGSLLTSEWGGTRAGIAKAVALGAAGIAAAQRELTRRGLSWEIPSKYLNPGSGRRMHDLVVRVGGRVVAFEVKKGHVTATARILEQIKKDAGILKNTATHGIDEIVWILESASDEVLEALFKAGIQWEFIHMPVPPP
jgi:RHS repeat-associated protein